MLEQSDIAHYLLSLGLVKPRDVVEEDLTIADVSRRNSVFLATTRAGPSFVVKQAGPRSARTLAHEAAVLGALAGAAELAGRVPVVVHHEPEERRLVVRTPGGGRDWGDHRGRLAPSQQNTDPGDGPQTPTREISKLARHFRHQTPCHLGCEPAEFGRHNSTRGKESLRLTL